MCGCRLPSGQRSHLVFHLARRAAEKGRRTAPRPRSPGATSAASAPALSPVSRQPCGRVPRRRPQIDPVHQVTTAAAPSYRPGCGADTRSPRLRTGPPRRCRWSAGVGFWPGGTQLVYGDTPPTNSARLDRPWWKPGGQEPGSARPATTQAAGPSAKVESAEKLRASGSSMSHFWPRLASERVGNVPRRAAPHRAFRDGPLGR